MATTTIEQIELQLYSEPRPDHHSDSNNKLTRNLGQQTTITPNDGPELDASSNVATAIPDGGYGWTIVFSCALMNFFNSGFSGSWGVLQAALLQSDLADVPASTVSWVGSLSISCVVAFGLFAVRLLPVMGARNLTIVGQLLASIGIFASGFTTSNLGGLFATAGALVGLGISLVFMISNTIPTQYFNGSLGGKLGLANGIVKLGGGIGATVLSLALEALNRKVGTAWTFRIFGMLNFAISMPAAWLIRERIPIRKVPLVDLSVFRSLPYTAIFVSGAICVFALYVPGFFLPLFANSIGLSSSTGAGIVAGFNLSSAVGRFGAGPLCDRIGAVNTLLITLVLNAVSMLAIWPVSSSLGPLVVFAVFNGIANGAFFTCMPTAVTSLVGPGRAAVGMSTALSGWTIGYLLGTPIAGYLLKASKGTDVSGSVNAYRPAIFYAGAVATASSAFVILARLAMSKQLTKKI